MPNQGTILNQISAAGLILLIALLPQVVRAQQQTAEQRKAYLDAVRSGPVPYKNMREALAAMKSSDPAEVQKAYDYLPRVPIQDHDDLMALYSAARKREDAVPLFADKIQVQKYVGAGSIISERLRGITAPQFQADVVSLLGQEYDSLQSPFSGVGLSREQILSKQSLQQDRVFSLIDAAVDGKNENARPTLRSMSASFQGSEFGKKAADALGKMGHPDDLDFLIGLIEKRPNTPVPLASFGTQVVPRVMREIDDPKVSESVKPALTSGLAEVSSHDNIALYVPLLKHKNKSVVQTAALALGLRLRSSDGDAIRDMMESSDWFIRGQAMTAICQHAWSEDFAPLIVNALKHDSEADNRAYAAHCIYRHNLRSAIPALEEALNDPGARLAARYALDRLSGKKRH